MNYDTKEMRAALQAAETRREFANWLATDGDLLVSAALLLGGKRWERHAERVQDLIRTGTSPEAVEADLIALHRLLTLQFTDNLESIEAFHFTNVHPDDARADDARVCAEALESGLDAMRFLAEAAVREVA